MGFYKAGSDTGTPGLLLALTDLSKLFHLSGLSCSIDKKSSVFNIHPPQRWCREFCLASVYKGSLLETAGGPWP